MGRSCAPTAIGQSDSVRRDPLELAQPRVGHDGTQDRGQVAEGNKGMVDGGGKVIVPPQEVFKVKHQHSCMEGREGSK